MTQALANPKQDSFDNLRALLISYKDQIQMALPQIMKPERMIRVAMTAVGRNPKLMECTPASFVGAILQSAQLGLEPDSVLGQAYLIPFNNKRLGRYEVQFMPGFKGLLTLARRSGEISTIMAQEVHAKDKFSYQYGDTPKLMHVPSDDDDPGEVAFFYAIGRLKDGGVQFEVMSKKKMDRHRDRYSKAAQDGPWVSNYEEMGKKTVLRKLCKLLPASVELQKAVALDEYVEAQVGQGLNILAGDVEDSQDGQITEQPEEKKEGLKEKLKERAGATKTVPQEPELPQDARLAELDGDLNKAKTKEDVLNVSAAWSKREGLPEDLYSEGGARINHRFKELP